MDEPTVDLTWIDSYDNNGFGLTVCPLNWNGDWE